MVLRVKENRERQAHSMERRWDLERTPLGIYTPS